MSDFYAKDENYDIPNESNYMSLEDGDNVFRILGSFKDKTAIQGVEYWTEENGQATPHRIHVNETLPKYTPKMGKFGPDKPKYFWAFPVWNYADKKVQILSITQKTILRDIKKYIENPKWGNPSAYDFIISKEKNGEKTEYATTVNPKEKLEDGILEMYKAMDITIEALFTNGDPFAEASAEQLAEDADKAIA